MLPFMSLALIFALCEWGEQIWMRVLCGVLFGWSLVATWGMTLAEQAFPPDTMRNPWIEHAWPNWQTGNIARNLGMFLHLHGITSLLPLLVAVMVLLAALRPFSRRAMAPEADMGGV
jgi:hypothetical protein